MPASPDRDSRVSAWMRRQPHDDACSALPRSDVEFTLVAAASQCAAPSSTHSYKGALVSVSGGRCADGRRRSTDARPWAPNVRPIIPDRLFDDHLLTASPVMARSLAGGIVNGASVIVVAAGQPVPVTVRFPGSTPHRPDRGHGCVAPARLPPGPPRLQLLGRHGRRRRHRDQLRQRPATGRRRLAPRRYPDRGGQDRPLPPGRGHPHPAPGISPSTCPAPSRNRPRPASCRR